MIIISIFGRVAVLLCFQVLSKQSKIKRKQSLVHYSSLLFQDHTNSILTIIIIIRDMRGVQKTRTMRAE